MTSSFFRCCFAASLISLAGLASCANKGACCDTKADAAAPSTGTVAVVNTLCPVGEDDFGSKERPAELARTWNGTSIGFCCESCVKSFDKMSDEKKSATAAAALANKAM